MAGPPGTRSSRLKARSEALLIVGAVLTIFLFAFPAILATLADGPLFYYRVMVLIADVPLAVAVIAVVVRWTVTRSRPSAAVTAGLAIAITLVVAFAVHPSPQGVQSIARLLAALALAVALTWVGAHGAWPLAVGAFGAAAISQTGLAIAQVVLRRPLGLPSLGEFADPLYKASTQLAPRGTMYHHYSLAAFAVLASVILVAQGLRSARATYWWIAAAAVAAIPIGFTYSRAALLGLGLAVTLLAIGGRARPRVHAIAIAALLVGAGVPALVVIDGWVAQSGKGVGIDGRDILIRQGLEVYAMTPLTGVGPGRMVLALVEEERQRPGSVAYLEPAHGIPILLLIEGGVQAAAASIALLGLALWRARRSWIALAVLSTYLPFVLLDHFPYTHAQGLVLSAMWLAATEVTARLAPSSGGLRDLWRHG